MSSSGTILSKLTLKIPLSILAPLTTRSSANVKLLLKEREASPLWTYYSSSPFSTDVSCMALTEKAAPLSASSGLVVTILIVEPIPPVGKIAFADL